MHIEGIMTGEVQEPEGTKGSEKETKTTPGVHFLRS